ncbi:MAG: amidophosphoribosyltransferase, partial [Bacilli bacterium]
MVNEEEIFDELKEECGIFGIVGHKDSAQMTYYGLHALQHRGQESAGICTTSGEKFSYHRGMGLVTEAFSNNELSLLEGMMSIGHVRYSTTGDSHLQNAQPLIFKYREGELAIATNGNLVNASQLKYQLEQEGSIFQTTSDTEVIAHLIARSKYDNIEDAVKETLKKIKGAFALLIMTNEKLIVAQDPNGLRPLVMGRIDDAYCFSSESCAFDTVGAKYVSDIEPGQMLTIDLKTHEMITDRFAEHTRRAMCSMEYIYFSRPDSDIDGINIHLARKRLGHRLAEDFPVDADVVTGVPDSSISAAIGYAEALGIPYELGLIKNRYVGRTFIQPSQEL